MSGISPDAVQAANDRAYVASVHGVTVFRVRDNKLEEIIHVPTFGRAHDVSLVERTLYVADGLAGLTTLDLKNPDEPKVIGRTDLSGECTRVVGSTHGVAVLCSDGKVALVRPANPVVSLELAGEPRDAVWIFDKLYVAAAGDGLVRIDARNEARITYRDRALHRALSVTAIGHRLVLGLRDKRILVLDAAGDVPRIMGEVAIANRPTRLLPSGNEVLVASNWLGDTGATWLDVSGDGGPRVLKRLSFSAVAGSSAGDKKWIVARREHGLSIVHSANDAGALGGVEGVRFDRLTMSRESALSWAMESAKSWAWTTEGGFGPHAERSQAIADAIGCGNAWCVFEASGRICREHFDASRSEANECMDIPHGGGSLAWQSMTNMLWAFDGSGGVHGLQTEPRLREAVTVERISSIAPQYFARFVVDGSIGVAVDPEFAMLQIIDLSKAPRFRGRFLLHARPSAVALAGHFAFVAEPRAGLQVIDIADPDAPREAFWMPRHPGPRGVAARRSATNPTRREVALAEGEGGVSLWAWDDLRELALLRRSDTAGFAVDVAFEGEDIWVADTASVGRFRLAGQTR